jgi:drug/metabolite transporter (DMT)-like permease
VNRHLLGILVALVAAALYAAAVGIQAFEARRAPASDRLRFTLLGRLLRRHLWLAGASIGVVGWVVQASALSFAPLTLVEPALAATLVFLLIVGSRVLGEHVEPREVAGVVAVSIGLAGLGLAAPSHSPHHETGVALVALALLTTIVIAPYAIGVRRHTPPLLVAASAGVAYAVAGLGTKFGTDDLHHASWVGTVAWLLMLGGVSVVGQLNEMSALQQRPVTQVAPSSSV